MSHRLASGLDWVERAHWLVWGGGVLIVTGFAADLLSYAFGLRGVSAAVFWLGALMVGLFAAARGVRWFNERRADVMPERDGTERIRVFMRSGAERLFVHAMFSNPSEHREARGLRATVAYVRLDDWVVGNETPELTIVGKWADWERHGSDRWDRVDLKARRTAALDLGFRNDTSGKGAPTAAPIYAFNDENWASSGDGEARDRALRHSSYVVVVRLHGERTDDLGEYRYLMRIRDGNLDVEPFQTLVPMQADQQR